MWLSELIASTTNVTSLLYMSQTCLFYPQKTVIVKYVFLVAPPVDDPSEELLIAQ